MNTTLTEASNTATEAKKIIGALEKFNLPANCKAPYFMLIGFLDSLAKGKSLGNPDTLLNLALKVSEGHNFPNEVAEAIGALCAIEAKVSHSRVK